MLKLTDSLIGKVTGGAVIGLDGGIWATTPGFYGNPSEFATLASAFNPNSEAAYKGIDFQGELYVVTSLSDDTLVAQKSSQSLVAARCQKCIVVGFNDDPMSFEKCVNAVNMLAESIRSSDDCP